LEYVFPFDPEEVVLKTRKDKTPTVKDVKIVHGEEARAVLREALLPVYTPRYLYDMVKPPSTIYYRVYRRNGEYGVFLLYEWPDQYIPPHKYDYEPIIIIMDKNLNIKEVYTDGFHYYIHKEKPPPLASTRPHIVVNAPWRSMEVKWSEPRDTDVMIYPADEVKGTVAPTKIQYLSDKVLQRLRSRSENPLAVNEKLIRNPFSVRYAKHWETFHEPTPEDLARDFAKNYGISRVDLIIMRIKLFIESLADKVKAFLQGLWSTVRNTLPSTQEEELLEEH